MNYVFVFIENFMFCQFTVVSIPIVNFLTHKLSLKDRLTGSETKPKICYRHTQVSNGDLPSFRVDDSLI